ncbi:hypothetical protein [uncultured Flavobacterium sp.]|uniref:hypothetical protein n=1 Tax=uncultured Flavobacterium sp. TaxID=165435 RepID=UPI0029304E61|nr:hypothetical protein [uncultured Flavobacterium sp.]
MNILKKIAGCFLIFIAGLLSIVALATLIEAVINFIKSSMTKDLPYLVALFIMVFFLALIVIYIVKLGLKLIKPKAIPEDSIDDIGS